MSRSFFILFVVLVATAITVNAQLCGENQHWVECGSGCPIRTCENRGSPPPRICPAVCRIGCFCSRGYIQKSQSDDTCVRIRDCPRNKE